MFHYLKGNSLSSYAPNVLNLEVRLFAENDTSCQSMLSEVLKLRQEHFHQVLSLEKNSAFLSILIIVEEPEGVSIPVELLFQCLHTSTSSIFAVDNECLEFEEVPLTLWQSVQTLLIKMSFISALLLFSSRLRFGSLSFWCCLFLFFLFLLDLLGLGLSLRLKLRSFCRDCAYFSISECSSKGRQLCHFVVPISYIGNFFLESGVEAHSERRSQESS